MIGIGFRMCSAGLGSAPCYPCFVALPNSLVDFSASPTTRNAVQVLRHSADLSKDVMDTPASWRFFSLFALRSLGVRSPPSTCIPS
jgi:hypothetical protein